MCKNDMEKLLCVNGCVWAVRHFFSDIFWMNVTH